MATTEVTKYATAVSGAGWTNFTVARLNADDASYATFTAPTPSGTNYSSVSDFDFAVPDGATIVSLKVEGDFSGGLGKFTMTLQPQANGASRCNPASSTGGGVFSTTSTWALPTVAELNAATFGVLATTTYAYNSAGVTVTLDYVRLTVVYLVPPTLTTAAASAITGTTASGGGNVTDDGDGTVSEKGVCWNTSGSPTTADDHTVD